MTSIISRLASKATVTPDLSGPRHSVSVVPSSTPATPSQPFEAQGICKIIDGVIAAWQPFAIGAAFMAAPALAYFLLKPRPPYKRGYERDKVYLYQYKRTPVIPSLSAHCLAVETFLRMASVKYDNVDANPWVRPAGNKGLPFVEINGVEISETTNIIQHLIRKHKIESPSVSDDFASRKTEIDRLNEELIWCADYFKYSSKNCKELFSEQISGKQSVSFPVVPHSRQILIHFLLAGKAAYCFGDRKKIAARIHSQMKTKFDEYFKKKHITTSDRSISSLGAKHLELLSKILGDKKYFSSEKPAPIDAIIFGTLAQILYVPIPSQIKQILIVECRNLVIFCENMRMIYWPDWSEILQGDKMNSVS